MRKYLSINESVVREVNESEMMNILYSKLVLYFLDNVGDTFSKKKKAIIFSEFRKYYKHRSEFFQKCLYDGCENFPSYCHSISEKSVLKNIAINNHVYGVFGAKKKLMSKIGIHSYASVFPGFCNTHDKALFSKLDDPNILIFDKVFYSQLLDRTFSREIYVRKQSVYYNQELIDKLKVEHEKVITSFLEEFNNSFLKNSKISFVGFKFNNFDLHSVIRRLEEEIITDRLILNAYIRGLLIMNLI
ncbi:hypothetical protein Q4595_06810 [Wenyingzhuangia sp. 1_MG-2023]|nr:hypothetical protein [Wenyingzhuangia sp. 1_MG-2023]